MTLQAWFISGIKLSFRLGLSRFFDIQLFRQSLVVPQKRKSVRDNADWYYDLLWVERIWRLLIEVDRCLPKRKEKA